MLLIESKSLTLEYKINLYNKFALTEIDLKRILVKNINKFLRTWIFSVFSLKFTQEFPRKKSSIAQV